MTTSPTPALTETIPGVGRGLPSVAKDYWTLTKPEVNFLVVAATFIGFYLGTQTGVRLWLLLSTLSGTFLVASGTATLNQFIERRHDVLMRRTANRPLPSGRVAPLHALYFGIAVSVVGGLQLWFTVNRVTSLLATLTLLLYLLIYTPLKRKTAVCTAVGAVPGALPPLIGWAAARGTLDPRAWLLFGILFMWQFPHFLAIALMYRKDYERAGFRMLPAGDRDGVFTMLEILLTSLVLIALSFVPSLLGCEGRLYLLGALVAGAFFLWQVARLMLNRTASLASRVLHGSVIYLPIVICLMAIDKRPW